MSSENKIITKIRNFFKRHRSNKKESQSSKLEKSKIEPIAAVGPVQPVHGQGLDVPITESKDSKNQLGKKWNATTYPIEQAEQLEGELSEATTPKEIKSGNKFEAIAENSTGRIIATPPKIKLQSIGKKPPPVDMEEPLVEATSETFQSKDLQPEEGIGELNPSLKDKDLANNPVDGATKQNTAKEKVAEFGGGTTVVAAGATLLTKGNVKNKDSGLDIPISESISPIVTTNRLQPESSTGAQEYASSSKYDSLVNLGAQSKTSDSVRGGDEEGANIENQIQSSQLARKQLSEDPANASILTMHNQPIDTPKLEDIGDESTPGGVTPRSEQEINDDTKTAATGGVLATAAGLFGLKMYSHNQKDKAKGESKDIEASKSADKELGKLGNKKVDILNLDKKADTRKFEDIDDDELIHFKEVSPEIAISTPSPDKYGFEAKNIDDDANKTLDPKAKTSPSLENKGFLGALGLAGTGYSVGKSKPRKFTNDNKDISTSNPELYDEIDNDKDVEFAAKSEIKKNIQTGKDELINKDMDTSGLDSKIQPETDAENKIKDQRGSMSRENSKKGLLASIPGISLLVKKKEEHEPEDINREVQIPQPDFNLGGASLEKDIESKQIGKDASVGKIIVDKEISISKDIVEPDPITSENIIESKEIIEPTSIKEIPLVPDVGKEGKLSAGIQDPSTSGVGKKNKTQDAAISGVDKQEQSKAHTGKPDIAVAAATAALASVGAISPKLKGQELKESSDTAEMRSDIKKEASNEDSKRGILGGGLFRRFSSKEFKKTKNEPVEDKDIATVPSIKIEDSEKLGVGINEDFSKGTSKQAKFEAKDLDHGVIKNIDASTLGMESSNINKSVLDKSKADVKDKPDKKTKQDLGMAATAVSVAIGGASDRTESKGNPSDISYKEAENVDTTLSESKKSILPNIFRKNSKDKVKSDIPSIPDIQGEQIDDVKPDLKLDKEHLNGKEVDFDAETKLKQLEMVFDHTPEYGKEGEDLQEKASPIRKISPIRKLSPSHHKQTLSGEESEIVPGVEKFDLKNRGREQGGADKLSELSGSIKDNETGSNKVKDTLAGGAAAVAGLTFTGKKLEDHANAKPGSNFEDQVDKSVSVEPPTDIYNSKEIKPVLEKHEKKGFLSSFGSIRGSKGGTNVEANNPPNLNLQEKSPGIFSDKEVSKPVVPDANSKPLESGFQGNARDTKLGTNSEVKDIDTTFGPSLGKEGPSEKEIVGALVAGATGAGAGIAAKSESEKPKVDLIKENHKLSTNDMHKSDISKPVLDRIESPVSLKNQEFYETSIGVDSMGATLSKSKDINTDKEFNVDADKAKIYSDSESPSKEKHGKKGFFSSFGSLRGNKHDDIAKKPASSKDDSVISDVAIAAGATAVAAGGIAAKSHFGKDKSNDTEGHSGKIDQNLTQDIDESVSKDKKVHSSGDFIKQPSPSEEKHGVKRGFFGTFGTLRGGTSKRRNSSHENETDHTWAGDDKPSKQSMGISSSLNDAGVLKTSGTTGPGHKKTVSGSSFNITPIDSSIEIPDESKARILAESENQPILPGSVLNKEHTKEESRIISDNSEAATDRMKQTNLHVKEMSAGLAAEGVGLGSAMLEHKKSVTETGTDHDKDLQPTNIQENVVIDVIGSDDKKAAISDAKKVAKALEEKGQLNAGKVVVNTESKKLYTPDIEESGGNRDLQESLPLDKPRSDIAAATAAVAGLGFGGIDLENSSKRQSNITEDDTIFVAIKGIPQDDVADLLAQKVVSRVKSTQPGKYSRVKQIHFDAVTGIALDEAGRVIAKYPELAISQGGSNVHDSLGSSTKEPLSVAGSALGKSSSDPEFNKVSGTTGSISKGLQSMGDSAEEDKSSSKSSLEQTTKRSEYFNQELNYTTDSLEGTGTPDAEVPRGYSKKEEKGLKLKENPTIASAAVMKANSQSASYSMPGAWDDE